jgi:hypothetical protein
VPEHRLTNFAQPTSAASYSQVVGDSMAMDDFVDTDLLEQLQLGES